MAKMTKVLALVAHDNMKRDLAEWVDWNSRNLSRHHLVCTGTTGKMVEKTLRDHREEDGPLATNKWASFGTIISLFFKFSVSINLFLSSDK